MGIKNFSSNITNTLSEIQSKNYKFTDSKKFTTIYFSGAVIIILLLKNYLDRFYGIQFNLK